MVSERKTVEFRLMYWNWETVDDETVFQIGGRTIEDKIVYCLIKGFEPHVHIELPKSIEWTQPKCNSLYSWITNTCKPKPTGMKVGTKYKLQYKEEIKVMTVLFPTRNVVYDLSRKFNNYRGFYVAGVGRFERGDFVIHENNIDPIIKFSAIKELGMADWVRVEGRESLEESEGIAADVYLCAHWKKVNKIDDKGSVNPSYCSFDIECYSKNHNSKLPDPTIIANVVFQISMVFGTLDRPDLPRTRILLTLGDPLEVPNTDEVIICSNEKALLLKFTNIVQKYNPDVWIGYNIMKFDWNYLILRAQLNGISKRFLKLGRNMYSSSEIKKSSWSSGAYGEQEFLYPICHGRINMDVLLEIERNFKLPTYRLDAVAEKFLGKNKDDVNAIGLFMLYQLTDEILPEVLNQKITKSQLWKFKRRVKTIFELRKTHGVVRKYRKRLLDASVDTFEFICREAMAITGKYCVQDTILPIELAEKFHMWSGMTAMSNVMCIPMEYLYTRGQQIRAVAQVYRETLKRNIIIPYIPKGTNKTKFQGATVIEANVGYYLMVSTLDFMSLYPAIIRGCNICYTTASKNNEQKDGYTEYSWDDDHVGCEHDPQKRKKKITDVICNNPKYYFQHIDYKFNDNGTYKRENEGIIPMMERNLMATRKIYKKKMAEAEAILSMDNGTATDGDVMYYKKQGWKIIKQGELTKDQKKLILSDKIEYNARQLAVKVSCNSMYGAMGVRDGMMPFLPGASTVTAMGRRFIMMAIDRIRKEYGDGVNLVYGDTDSCMISFPQKSLKENFRLAKEASFLATHCIKCYLCNIPEGYTINVNGERIPIYKVSPSHSYFSSLTIEVKKLVLLYDDCPMDLEFENMYGKFLLLTKKRYIAHSVNEARDVIGITKKGLVLTRRDNCKHLKTTYEAVVNAIMDGINEKEVMYELYDNIHKMFTRQVPETNYIIYVGVKKLINYASTVKVKNGPNVIEYFVDPNGQAFTNPDGPLDPRLVYKNITQVILSKKIMSRGQDVPAGTRLEYVFIETENTSHVGEKAEEYTYYIENKDIEDLKIDYLHYLERQLTKPVTELLSVKFTKDIIPYISIEDQFAEYIKHIDEYRADIRNIISYTKEARRISFKQRVGWKVLGVKTKRNDRIPKIRVYKFGLAQKRIAQVTYVIDRVKSGDMNVSKKFVDLCLLIKSMHVINQLHKRFGLTKRKWRKPTNVGEKLPHSPNVVITTNLYVGEGVNKGDVVKVIAKTPDEDNDRKWLYDVLVDSKSGHMLKNIPRSHITPFIRKDENVMKRMLAYRNDYRNVVNEYNQIIRNTRVKFID